MVIDDSDGMDMLASFVSYDVIAVKQKHLDRLSEQDVTSRGLSIASSLSRARTLSSDGNYCVPVCIQRFNVCSNKICWTSGALLQVR